jgi:hypothetical protein
MREVVARWATTYHVWKAGTASHVRASLFMHRRNTCIWISNLRWRRGLALSQMAWVVREC